MSTAALVERYRSLTFAELTPSVLERVHESVLDQLGCMIGGRDLDSTTAVASLTAALGGRPTATTVTGERASAPWAALVNATSAHGLELDDTENSSSLHPGNVVVPAVLALAEELGSSGQEAALAIVAGYDAMIRIGQASDPRAQYRRGFHPTATCGAFGATVAASLLLGLDDGAMANALGLAGSMAAGSLEYMADGSWAKRWQVAAAAHNGILAAVLAGRGFTGPTSILEGRYGFLNAYSDDPHPERLVEGLAEPFAILGVSIKAFACCRYCQTPVDAVLQLRERERFTADDVVFVDVGLVSTGIPIVAEPRAQKLDPRNAVDAQFSLPYCVAVALARGGAFIDEFSPGAITDPVVRRLMPLISAHTEDSLDARYPQVWPARVTVKLTDGRVLDLALDDCRGDPSRPLSWAELAAKFTALVEPKLSAAGAQELVDAAAGLSTRERAGDVLAIAVRERSTAVREAR